MEKYYEDLAFELIQLKLDDFVEMGRDWGGRGSPEYRVLSAQLTGSESDARYKEVNALQLVKELAKAMKVALNHQLQFPFFILRFQNGLSIMINFSHDKTEFFSTLSTASSNANLVDSKFTLPSMRGQKLIKDLGVGE